MINNTDIVFVGAGPVGLWTAVQSKIINKKLNIILLDKHSEYQRTQHLRVDPSALKGIPDDKELNALCSEWKKKKFIPIKEIETKLKKIAQKHGIIIKHQEVKNAHELKKTYPKARVIVGADGAWSTVRRQVFGDVKKVDQPQEYLVQIRYKVKDPLEQLRGSNKMRIMKVTKTVVEENISKKTNEVSLRFFIDKKTYESVKNAKAKSPWKIDDERVPDNLQKIIQQWLYTRKTAMKEEISSEFTPELTSIKLSIYTSKKFVIQGSEKSNLTWCLVGDAAGGVPYFRSLNKGLLEGTQLAKVLSQIKQPENPTNRISDFWRFSGIFGRKTYEGENISKDFKSYAYYVRSQAAWENFVARIKTFAINFFAFIVITLRVMTPTPIMNWVCRKYLNWEENVNFNLLEQSSAPS